MRVLAAGSSELLISGDSEGFVNFFRVPSVPQIDNKRQSADIVHNTSAALPTLPHEVASTTAATASTAVASAGVLHADCLSETAASTMTMEPATALAPQQSAKVIAPLPEIAIGSISQSFDEDVDLDHCPDCPVDSDQFEASLSPRPDAAETAADAASSSPLPSGDAVESVAMEDPTALSAATTTPPDPWLLPRLKADSAGFDGSSPEALVDEVEMFRSLDFLDGISKKDPMLPEVPADRIITLDSLDNTLQDEE